VILSFDEWKMWTVIEQGESHMIDFPLSDPRGSCSPM